MTVGRQYMLVKPSGPSRPKLFLDQTILPLAIDAAGGCEVAVQRLSQRIGLRPAALVGAALLTGLLMISMLWRRGLRAAR